MKEKLGSALSDLIPQALTYGKMLIIALIILFLGFWLIKKLIRGMKALMEKRNLDPTLTSFSVSVINIALKVLLIISVVSYIGIPMTSFVAILGAASLAVGMALQGTLQNFAGGVMLLLFRPFKVGDFIEVSGYSGVVKEIQIFNTFLTTGDNKVVLIPNGGISTSSMTNYSRLPERRVDLTFGIGYGDDIDKAYEAIRAVIARKPEILTTPEPFMAVSNLGDNSVDIVVRIWVKSEDYWAVFFYMNEFVKKEFDKQGISIPFPQRDVHIIKD
ncbi:MAG: mechanosensitive ion channel [Bacteroidales bacterium]|nr:mechanosensitive ion channel [Bacteroidales bacterium]MDY4173774.1 mechanosensitive ion channel [Bacteroidales bacterium]